MENTSPVPWSEREAEEASDKERENTLLSRIPLLAGDDKKMEYLSWRATGFPVRQACELTGIRQHTVNKWRNSDPEFRIFESDRLPELQARVGKDLLRLEFMRNFRLLLRKDAEVIWKATMTPDELTDREWAYFRQIRKHYTPGEFLSLEKALNPEKHKERPPIIRLSFGASASLEQLEVMDAEFSELDSA